MKHATTVALDALEPLLVQLRAIDGLTEKKRGVFYRKSSAFLHVHEDPAGLFADLRVGLEWVRLAANTAAERRALVREARVAVGVPLMLMPLRLLVSKCVAPAGRRSHLVRVVTRRSAGCGRTSR